MKKVKQSRVLEQSDEEGETTKKKVEQQKKAKQERKGEGKKRKNKSSFCHAKIQNTLQNLSTK